MPDSQIRRGIFTSEFLVTILSIVTAVAAQIEGALPSPWGAIIAAVGVAAYNLSRGLAKQGSPQYIAGRDLKAPAPTVEQ